MSHAAQWGSAFRWLVCYCTTSNLMRPANGWIMVEAGRHDMQIIDSSNQKLCDFQYFVLNEGNP